MTEAQAQADFSIGPIIIGVILLIIPLVLALAAPDAYVTTQIFLRIIAALGGGLVASQIPGIIKVQFPGVEALGGIAAFALILMYEPLWESTVTNSPVDAKAPPAIAISAVETSLPVELEGPEPGQEPETPSSANTTTPTAGPPVQPSPSPAPSQNNQDPVGSTDSPDAIAVNTEAIDLCVQEKIAAFQKVKETSVEGGARVKSAGFSGNAQKKSADICLSLGPKQEFVSASTDRLSCHGGRCAVTAPVNNDGRVCVTASARSQGTPFGAGGSGQYRLRVKYRDLASGDERELFEAQCRQEVAGSDV